MNIAHYVSTFQLRATQQTDSIKGFDDQEISSIHEQSTESTIMMLQQWKLPQKVNLIEKMVQIRKKEEISRCQESSQNQQIFSNSITQVFCVGFQDSPHILALLYSILFLVKQNELNAGEFPQENKQGDSQQYERNYLHFKYEIYLLAQKILPPHETLILVENLTNLYYCTDINTYLTKNDRFVFIFYKLFRFAVKNGQQGSNLSGKNKYFQRMFAFSKKFPFLVCNLYDYEQSFQYFKGESSIEEPNYDIMELNLRYSSNTVSSLKTINKVFIVKQCKCYFTIHFKSQLIDELNKKLNQTPDNASVGKQRENEQGKNKSIYSTPKFILSRSKKRNDSSKQMEVQIEKFEQAYQESNKNQRNSVNSSKNRNIGQVSSSVKSSNAKLFANLNKQEESTEFQSQMPNSNSKFSDNTNTRNSPKFQNNYQNHQNLSEIPQENSSINANVEVFEINKKLEKVDLYSTSRFAELLTAQPFRPPTKRGSINMSSSNASPQKKYKNLIQNYMKKSKQRHGPIYESLNVGKDFKVLLDNPNSKKIRQTLNMKLQSYKNFTKKNISQKLLSPKKQEFSGSVAEPKKKKSVKNIKMRSYKALPNHYKFKRNISQIYQGPKPKTQKKITDVFSPTSAGMISQARSNQFKSPPEKNMLNKTVITKYSPSKTSCSVFPQKITFIYGNQTRESPESRQRSLSPNCVSRNSVYFPYKATSSEKWINVHCPRV